MFESVDQIHNEIDDDKRIVITVKPFLSDHSKLGKAKIVMTSGILMDKSISECSPWSILQYF